MQFDPAVAGQINYGISVALAKLQTRYPGARGFLAQETADISQAVWVTVLTKYDPKRAAYRAESRKKHTKAGLAKVSPFKSEISAGSVTSGYAYRVTFNLAMDYLRGRPGVAGPISYGKLRADSLDREWSAGRSASEGHTTTLHDVVPDHAPSVYSVICNDQADSYLNAEIADLTPAQRQTLLLCTIGASLDNRQRVAKVRILDKITANLPKSLRSGKRSKAKGRKHTSKGDTNGES